MKNAGAASSDSGAATSAVDDGVPDAPVRGPVELTVPWSPPRHPPRPNPARRVGCRVEHDDPGERRLAGVVDERGQDRSSRARAAVSDGVLPTLTPAASRASFLAWAVPDEPETMAPAWPMVLPSGAVKPAT